MNNLTAIEKVNKEIDEITTSIHSLQTGISTKDHLTISQLDVLMQKKAALLEKKCSLINEYSNRLEEARKMLEEEEKKAGILRKILETVRN